MLARGGFCKERCFLDSTDVRRGRKGTFRREIRMDIRALRRLVRPCLSKGGHCRSARRCRDSTRSVRLVPGRSHQAREMRFKIIGDLKIQAVFEGVWEKSWCITQDRTEQDRLKLEAFIYSTRSSEKSDTFDSRHQRGFTGASWSVLSHRHSKEVEFFMRQGERSPRIVRLIIHDDLIESARVDLALHPPVASHLANPGPLSIILA